MAAPPGRFRTQSMVDRMSKQSVDDGYNLWDRGYPLGALRLLQFKVDDAPPFQKADLHHVIGDILFQLQEIEDAVDQWEDAKNSYDMINQPQLAKLCLAKSHQTVEDCDSAFTEINRVIEEENKDYACKANESMESKRNGIARCHHFRAELALKLEKFELAATDAAYATSLNMNRIHIAHNAHGSALYALDKPDEAAAAFQKATKANGNLVKAYEGAVSALKDIGKVEDALVVCDSAIAIHPAPFFLMEKAYLLSEMGKDTEALAFLDATIKNPPHEETEAHMGQTPSVAQLYRTKAAILADLSDFEGASQAIGEAVKIAPDDEEMADMTKDIRKALYGPYLEEQQIPQILDELINELITKRPTNPLRHLVSYLETPKAGIPPA